MLLLSDREWAIGALSSLIIFQRDDSCVLKKKHPWVVELAKGFLKDLHLNGAEEGFTITGFLK